MNIKTYIRKLYLFDLLDFQYVIIILFFFDLRVYFWSPYK